MCVCVCLCVSRVCVSVSGVSLLVVVTYAVKRVTSALTVIS